MRPVLAGAAVALAAGAAVFGVAPGVGATPRAHSATRRARSAATPPTNRSNRAAARADAARMLAALQLPSGAAGVATEPSGDSGFLKPMPALSADSARAVVDAWWRVTGDAAGVLAYIRAHPPAGATLAGTGESGNTHTGVVAQSLDYEWPPIAGVLGQRELQITVMDLPGGAAGVLAEAQSDWVVPRPSGERIPAAVREIDIAIARPQQPAGPARGVTGRARVRRIVALFNAMPITQPEVTSCPAEMLSGSRTLTFTFRATAGGAALARATYVDYPPLDGPSDQCKSIQLTIGGKAEDALTGGDFIARIDRVLGANLLAGRR